MSCRALESTTQWRLSAIKVKLELESHKSYTRAIHSNNVLDSQDAPQEELHASLEHQVSSFIEKKMDILQLGIWILVLVIHYQAKKPYQIL